MPTIINGDNGVDKILAGAVQFDDVSAGMVIQVQNYTTGVWVSGTTVIPLDDTIPQITEGTQFLSLSFTPKKANSKLKVEIVLQLTSSIATDGSMALFKDSGVNAIASAITNMNASNIGRSVVFIAYIDAINTNTAIYTVRVGGTSGTVYLNGFTGRYHGGSLASSITITEIAQ